MRLSILLLCILALIGCKQNKLLQSPDGEIHATIQLTNGKLSYQVMKDTELVIQSSALGFNLKEHGALVDGFTLIDRERTEMNESWTAVWGPEKKNVNRYNQAKLELKHEESGIYMNVVFRAFNDGVAFRYEFPKQDGLEEFTITDELSEFAIVGNPKSWWIMADFDSYEKLYYETPVSEAQWVNTPITMRTNSGLHVSLHEAALTNYSGMTLKLKDGGKINTFVSELVPWADGSKVKTKAGMHTPWRTITISNSAAQLVESNMIVNLNEPCKIEDTSWIEPMKYMGIWWGMHIGTETWVEGDKHGATTENTMRYIDFAADNNIQGLVVEGWNAGWDKWGAKDAFDHVTPAADYDLEKVAAYAKEKGVELIMHHETGGDAVGYEALMDSAYSLCQHLDIKALKTGYAGGIYPRGEYHHGQYMVEHYQKVVETAAQYGIMINAHEPIKPTGKRRTWPNMMTREGVRGMEWNAWSDGNPPSHTVTIPFTRMLGGPVDYTPGTFDLMLKNFADERVSWNTDDISKTRTHTTLAKQLALFVILYSPMQMASDVVNNYINHPAFAFIANADIDFDETRVLNGEVGQYITTARRTGNNWLIGSATNEKARDINIKLDFLEQNKAYEATIYADKEGSDWQNNPEQYTISKQTVKHGDKLSMKLAAGGGQAISIIMK
ncbi:glycoside hydrolase family 97 protein [Carboxylicivirga marina]|uniref:Glycoside hydrolase family 97 protein n=1 Tax=Carboxylicivirga marina TaxID=2800988 RepID=A0ABS1HKE3_9BACT|nr:glycoside hydrolase family 97 protein [Carboxylicivirga marina]MBK3518147.1 glycoside hydrolase family 97 protein [Carboxylicivirga marina]